MPGRQKTQAIKIAPVCNAASELYSLILETCPKYYLVPGREFRQGDIAFCYRATVESIRMAQREIENLEHALRERAGLGYLSSDDAEYVTRDERAYDPLPWEMTDIEMAVATKKLHAMLIGGSM